MTVRRLADNQDINFKFDNQDLKFLNSLLENYPCLLYTSPSPRD